MIQTQANKLYSLLYRLCNSEENIFQYFNSNIKILSVLLYMNDGKYLGIEDLLDPNNIKTFSIINQKTDKMINILAKDVKSSSYRNGVLRINRYSTIVNSEKHDFAKQK